jgi:putative sugar O-methyltransferase
MGINARIRESLDSLLKQHGYRIVQDQHLYEWQKPSSQARQPHRTARLPGDAASYLSMNNPRLRELRTRYAAFNRAVTTPLIWTDAYVGQEEMLYFRGDNAYVWQTRRMTMNIMAYALTTYYAKSIDTLGLFEKLEEDDYFGVNSFNIGNRLVSRDLLDSILEIHFLEKHLNISSYANLSVLDIGAGYGRLAHRMVCSLPNIAQYVCTDAFPVSTFISEYYLRFRGLEGKAAVVPLDEIEHVLRKIPMDIAVNIHSFSECRVSAIEWWLSVLEKYRVKHLMIVPNPPELRTNDGIDFGDVIAKHGYKMIAKDPKYGDPVVQEYAINPSRYYLFELT